MAPALLERDIFIFESDNTYAIEYIMLIYTAHFQESDIRYDIREQLPLNRYLLILLVFDILFSALQCYMKIIDMKLTS